MITRPLRWIGDRRRRMLGEIALRGLRASPDPALRALANAVARGRQPLIVATESERRALAALAELRERLESSMQVVIRVDYGARAPRVAGSPDARAAGVTVQETLGAFSRRSSLSQDGLHLLFRLVRDLQPSVCLELGTGSGLSAAAIGLALRLNGRGTLVTLEGASALSAVVRQTLASLGLDNVSIVEGRFQDTLAGVLRERGRVDLAFVDGDHDEGHTLAHVDSIRPCLSVGGLLVLDDIDWSAGMRRAWRSISSDGRFPIAVQVGGLGICAAPTGSG